MVCSGFVDVNNNLIKGYTCKTGYTNLYFTNTVKGCMSCAGTTSDAVNNAAATAGYVSCTAVTTKSDTVTTNWVMGTDIKDIKCLVGSAANAATGKAAV